MIDPLTKREYEILELLGKHMTNKEIASQLHMSVGTVQQHLNHTFGELGVMWRRKAAAKRKSWIYSIAIAEQTLCYPSGCSKLFITRS